MLRLRLKFLINKFEQIKSVGLHSCFYKLIIRKYAAERVNVFLTCLKIFILF